MGVTKAEWERAARAAGLEVVEHECPECGGAGRLDWISRNGYWRSSECPTCAGGRGLVCPLLGERVSAEMAWVRVDGVVSSAGYHVGCSCGCDRPAVIGGELCSECLEGAETDRGVAA